MFISDGDAQYLSSVKRPWAISMAFSICLAVYVTGQTGERHSSTALPPLLQGHFPCGFPRQTPVPSARGKMAEECVHNTAFCCVSVGYGPYQNITNLGVLIPSISDAVRRVWLKKVSGGASPSLCLVVNQQQNIKC